MVRMADTIYAPATAPGPAGVAIIRLSGPEAGAVLDRLVGGRPRPRRATRRPLVDPLSAEIIDDGIILWFPGPASFTGEDVAELHLHGGRAVIDATLAILAVQPGLRLAEPGEFTRRAFEHGKLDLTAAEGLADLVAAETAAQRRQALRQLGGELGRLYEGWRDRLIHALAHIEAALDFPDEDLPPDLIQRTRDGMAALETEVAAHLADGGRGERLRAGLSVAIIGPPNAGKSSLMNLLARRDVAIVSSVAGTTRDVIEVHLELGGLPVVLADTPRIRRARLRAEQADLLILVQDATMPDDQADIEMLRGPDTIVVCNKTDCCDRPAGIGELPISVRTGAGIGALLETLERELAKRVGGSGAAVLTRPRHRAALEQVAAALSRGRSATAAELAAEDLRLAIQALGGITGRVDIDDILDVIFREFCIGK
jgi:tRNA modification GTPase